MSFTALAWAANQRPGNLAAKMVLLCLANFADEHGCAYPSTAAIADFGGMDHKTATAALDRLAAAGLIADTGEREGHTKQIKVYRLALESLPKTEASPAKATRKRKPPVSSVKAPQKRCTDTIREPIPVQTTSSQGERASEKQDQPDDIRSLGLLAKAKPAAPSLAERVTEAWNSGPGAAGAHRARPLDKGRRAALTARVREHGEPAVFEAIGNLGRSAWHTGRNDRGWRADLGWLLKSPEHFQRALELDRACDPPPGAGGSGGLVAAINGRRAA